MNNIPQKNIILQNTPCTDIPYKSIQMVDHYACFDAINAVDVNNLAGQMVDNDLYIENALKNLSSSSIGPKILDSSTIASQSDGYKVFGDLKQMNNMRILHKVEIPLSATISKIRDGQVKMLHQFGDVLFAGIGGKLLMTSNPNGEWIELKHGSASVDAKFGLNVGFECLFAAADGIYQLSSFTEEGATSATYAVIKLNAEDFDAQCIAVDDKLSSMVVGTPTGILSTQYTTTTDLAKMRGILKFSDVLLYDGEDFIEEDSMNDLALVKTTPKDKTSTTIAASDKALYQQTKTNYLEGRQTIYLGIAEKFISAKLFNGRMVFATTVGLLAESLTSKKELDLLFEEEIGQTRILKIETVGNSTLLVATNYAIYSLNRGLDKCKKLIDLRTDFDDIVVGETLLSFCAVNSSAKFILGVTASRVFFVDLSLGEVYPQIVMKNAEFTNYLSEVFPSNHGLADTRDILVASNYIIFRMDYGLASLDFTLSPSSSTERITRVVNVDFGKMIGSNELIKFLTCDGARIAVLASGFECIDGTEHPTFSNGVFSSNLVDAIAVSWDRLLKDHIVALDENGRIYLVKFDYAASEFSLVKVSDAQFGDGATQLAEFGTIIAVRGNEALSSAPKEELFSDAFDPGSTVKVVSNLPVLNDMAASENQLHLLAADGRITNFIGAEVLSDLEYIGDPIRSMAFLQSLSTQVLATSAGLSAYVATQSAIEDDQLKISGFWSQLAGGGATRVALTDKVGSNNARTYWIDDSGKLNSGWLIPAYDDVAGTISSIAMTGQKVVDTSTTLYDMASFADSSLANKKQRIFVVGTSDAYQLKNNYDLSVGDIGQEGSSWRCLACLGECNLEVLPSIDNLAFILGNTSSLYGCTGDYGHELENLTKINASSGKHDGDVKKILYGGYDITYLAGGEVHELYNNTKTASTVKHGKWCFAISSSQFLSDVVDIDRVYLGSTTELSAGNSYYVDSYVTLGAYNKTIFRKRRFGYSELNPNKHSLCVQVTYNADGGFKSNNVDTLSNLAYPILNLDHTKTESGVTNILASSRATAGGNGAIYVFQLALSSDQLDADDSAELSNALSCRVSNLSLAYFLDSSRILYKTTDSKVYQISLTRDSSGKATGFVVDDDSNVSSVLFEENVNDLVKAQTINDQNMLFIRKRGDGAIINCLFNEEIGKVDPAATLWNIHMSEDDMVYAMFSSNFKRYQLDVGGTLSRIGIGGQGIAYANNNVFVVGSNGQLSSYPLDSPSNVVNLGGSQLVRAYASAIDASKTKIIAYSRTKVYEKTIKANPDESDALAAKDTSHDVSTSMSDLYNVPNQKYQLTFNKYEYDPITGDLLSSYASNIFYDKVLSSKISPAEQVYISQSGKVMYDNGNRVLVENGIDSETSAVKFIVDPSGRLETSILSSSQVGASLTSTTTSLFKSKVLAYPSLSTQFESDDCIDAICRDGGRSWFWKSSSTSAWMYFDRTTERKLPKDLDIKSAVNSDGTEYLIADGLMYTPIYLKAARLDAEAGPVLSAPSGTTIASLGTSKGGLTLNMIIDSGARTTELHESSTSLTSEIPGLSTKFFASSKRDILAFNKEGVAVPTTVSGLWMVDDNPYNGIYAKVSDDALSDYGRWLCQSRYGTTLDPMKNVDLEVSSISRGSSGSTWILDGDKATRFTRYGIIDVFEIVPGSTKTSGSSSSRFTKICELSGSETKVLLASEEGINSYDAQDGLIGIMKATSTPVHELTLLDSNNEARYVYTIDRQVLSSDNARIWKKMFELPIGSQMATDVLQWSTTQYLFGTPVGLYSTNYKYNMIDDIHSFSKSDALCMYNDLLSGTMSSEYEDTLQNHLCGEHLPGSFISRVNNDFLSVAFDDIDSTWQKMVVSTDLAFSVKNDMIAEMQFGSYNDGDIVASISSYATANELVELSTATYIMKRWMSGVTEIFVNIPSTKTYYLNNLYGAGDCRTLSSVVSQRKNIEGLVGVNSSQNGNVATHATEIQLGITSSEYHIDNLLAVEINGQSLPLKIYKDGSTNVDSDHGNLFKSYIEPSVVKSWDISRTDEDGNYLFRFACFGTDAQAIHLMFYDKNARTGSETFVVTFDPNGGDGNQTKQKFILVKDSDGYPVIEQKQLKKNKFSNTSSGYDKIFAGWSRYPLKDNEAPEYENTQVFPNASQWSELSSELLVPESTDTLKDKDGITLYAVWLTYQFSNDDTILVFDSDKTEFSIDSVGIDESTNLKDKVIVNWGD